MERLRRDRRGAGGGESAPLPIAQRHRAGSRNPQGLREPRHRLRRDDAGRGGGKRPQGHAAVREDRRHGRRAAQVTAAHRRMDRSAPQLSLSADDVSVP